jgi:hypothetical protein
VRFRPARARPSDDWPGGSVSQNARLMLRCSAAMGYTRRMLGRWSLWLLIAAAFASGCDGADQSAPSGGRRDAWAGQPPPSVASVKLCLRRHGLKVYGRPDPQPRPDTDASDHGELWAGGAHLYFYSSHRRAASLGPLLEQYVTAANRYSRRIHSRLVRRGSVRVIYERFIHKRAPEPAPIVVDACLRGAPAWDGA